MLTVFEALQQIESTVARLPSRKVDLSDAMGCVLANDIISETDSPPFDKAMMDGYAVRSTDLAEAGTELRVVAELTAGRESDHTLQPGEAIRIMTGAPVPPAADAVVRFEDTAANGSDRVTIQVAGAAPGNNIIRRGTSMRVGDRVIAAGRTIRPQEIAALAELGHAAVEVYPRPTIAILATGDELVPPGVSPGPGQIRNSNGPMLAAQSQRRGCRSRLLGIAPDLEAELEHHIREGLQYDILCLSGGVSAGKLDLVPKVLEKCGVREVFHKAQLKPGKPIWFGVLDSDRSPHGRGCCIFGLPGNPVSSMVCFELFVRTAIHILSGIEPPQPVPVRARLAVDLRYRDDRPTYFPSRLEWTSEGPVVTTVDWKGSSDIRSTVDADAMTLFPAGDRQYTRGDEMDVYPW